MSAGAVLLLAPGAAFVIVALFTPVVRGAALQLGLVSRARVDRWHRVPTPLLGGVAIFLGVAGSALLASFLLRDPGVAGALYREGRWLLSRWDGLVWAGVLVFFTGLTDDVRPLTPGWKLAGQIVAACVLLAAGIMLEFTGVYAVDAVISVAWFLAVTNGLNLLDNMDGLAGGVAAIAALCLGALFVLDGDLVLAIPAFALVGALAGFLLYNYPPARIFMGDSGSLFIGLILAGLALSPSPGLSRGLFAVVAVPVLVLAVPLFDTALVAVTRVLEGRPVARGGRDHSSHRLVALGLPERRAVQVLWALAAMGGVVAVLFRTRERAFAYLLGGFLLLALALFGVVLVRLSARRAVAGGAGVAGVGADGVAAVPNPLIERLSEWHERWPVFHFVLDTAAIVLAYYAAYLIRWDPGQLPAELEYFRRSLPVVLGAKLVAFAWMGMYAQPWAHFGLEDGGRVVRGNLVGSVLVAAALLVVERVGLSRGVLIIDFLVCSAVTMAARFSQRVLDRQARLWRRTGVAAVVFAAPDDAVVVLAALAHGERWGLRPVAVVDPQGRARKGSFKGYPCYGGLAGLEGAVREQGAGAVVGVGRGEGEAPTELESECRRLGVELYLLEVALAKAR